MLSWFVNRRPLYLAPMAGITNSIFRRLCKELGADVLVSEFVSADGILQRNERTRRMVEFDAMERPVGIQLFGAEPDRLADAAKAVMDWAAPDFIDLNFGCPVNKVVCREGGSALLRDCPRLARVAAAVVQAIAPRPVTAKIRIGWDASSINALRTSHILAESGVQAIAVHGRTKEQGYAGEADWETIAEVAAAASIPVVGNGDLKSAGDIAHRFRTTAVRGVMIGRAAIGHPWLFAQTKALLGDDYHCADVSLVAKWDFIVRHCRLLAAEELGQKHGLVSLRAHLMAYSKGMPGARLLRPLLQKVVTVSEVAEIGDWHLDWVSTSSPEEWFERQDATGGGATAAIGSPVDKRKPPGCTRAVAGAT